MKRIHHELTARLFQAMGSATRVHILTLVAQGPWTVGQLAEELGESIAATSAHLKVLRGACLLKVEKKGREVWCQIGSSEVVAALSAVQKAATGILPEFREVVRQNETDCFLARDVDLQQLADEVAGGRLTLIDLRPESEFRAGHLPRALSRPFSTLPDVDLSDLRGQKSILGYCRGPFCKKAKSGVELLNQRGVSARRWPGGVIEWQAAGLALEN